MQTQKILVIIPAYNEARAIKSVIRDIKKRHPNLPILVINDGSSDNTAQEATSTGNATVVSLPYNLGIGGAVQTGFKIACLEDYDVVVQIDGDAQHDPKYLMEVVKPVLSNQLDLCIGSRFLSNGTAGFRSTFARRMGIGFFSFLLKCLTRLTLTDPTSGYLAISKKLFQQFSVYYPTDFPEPETIQTAKRMGARIGEVPVKMRKRLGGVSSIRYFKTIYYMTKVTFAILIDLLRKKDRGEAKCKLNYSLFSVR